MSETDILKAGDIIANYTIVEKLGAGGMCQVYRGIDKLINRYVAIKILQNELHGEAISEFLDEGKLLAQMRHSNIVPIYSIGFERGIPWMAMACIEGWDLAEYVKDRPFTLEEARTFVEHATAALRYATKSNLIHLDIKPGNFLMDTNGIILLTDFGIARRISHIEQGLYDGQVLRGTPTYASPEHFLCSDVDLRTDIYSLGATIFHLISGKYPYTGRTVAELSQQHLTAQFPEALLVAKGIPEKWRVAIRKMMEKNPDDRFQSYDEIRDHFNIVDAQITVTDTNEKLQPKAIGRRSIPSSGGTPRDLFGLLTPDLANQGDELSKAGTMYTAEQLFKGMEQRGPLLKINGLTSCFRRLQTQSTPEADDKVLSVATGIPGYKESIFEIGRFMAEIMGTDADSDSEILALVGTDRAVKIGLLAGGLYSPWQGDIRLNHHNFWENAIYTGLLATFMADMLGYELDQLEFLCGVVHGIGRLVFMEMYPMKTIALWMKAYAHHVPLEELEITYFGVSSHILGAKWLQHYRIDPMICHIIANQKNPEKCAKSLTQTTGGLFGKSNQAMEEKVQILAHITASASSLVKELRLGFDGCSFLSITPWIELRETQLIFANRRNREVSLEEFAEFFTESCRYLPELPLLQLTSANMAQERKLLEKELRGTVRFSNMFNGPKN